MECDWRFKSYGLSGGGRGKPDSVEGGRPTFQTVKQKDGRRKGQGEDARRQTKKGGGWGGGGGGGGACPEGRDR